MTLIDGLNSFFPALLQRSVFAAVLIVVLLVLGRFFRNRVSPAIWFWLWLLVPVLLLFCVSIPSPISLANLFPQKESVPIIREPPVDVADEPPLVVSEKTTDDEENPFENEEEIALYDHSFSVPEEQVAFVPPFSNETSPKTQKRGAIPFKYLAAVWGCGVFCFFALLLFQILRFRQWVRSGTAVTDGKTLRIFERCKKIIRVNSWTMLVESPLVKGPFLMGVVRPVVVLPQHFPATLSPGEIRHLFLHELAHLKRCDLLTGWLTTLALALHWFNPLVWIMLRKMNHLREEAADMLVLKHLRQMQKLDYGATLIAISRKFAKPRLMPGIAGILETQTLLQRRIDMITNPIPRKKIWSVLAVGCCVMLLPVLLTDAKIKEDEASHTYPNFVVIEKEEAEEPIGSEKPAKQPAQPEPEKIDPKRVPKFVATFPKNKTAKVDPNITQVTVTFDIPMNGGRAWAQRSNQTALDFDEELELFWTADKKTCVAPVRLKPNKTYEILMNFKPFIGFASEAGVPAGELFFTFRTGPGPVTEEKRAQFAARNLTPESDGPSSKSSFLTGEKEKEALDALEKMAKCCGNWLNPKNYSDWSYSYHYQISYGGKTDEYDITIEKETLTDWTELCGTTYNSVLHALMRKIHDDDERQQVKFKEFTMDEKEIKIHFVTTEPLHYSYGNRMRGSNYGYFSGSTDEGLLTLDRKTMIPKQAVYGKGIGERFSSYAKIGDDFVPKKIQVKNGEMLFEMHFSVYQPCIWLLDRCVYTLPDGDQSRAEVTNVQIQKNDDLWQIHH